MRTGDIVLHRPTGETWLVAYVDDARGELAPCGWPFCLARVEDCELRESATDADSERLLNELARMSESANADFRKRWAVRVLAERAAVPS